MSTFFERLGYEIRSRNVVIQLIGINVIVFIVTLLVNAAGFLFKDPATIKTFVSWVAVPPALSDLAHKPWTLFTYMFVHDYETLWHIFFNMLILYFAGRIFLSELGPKRLWGTYILAGLSGAILFIISFNIFPVFNEFMHRPMVGASASVIGILIAIAVYMPNMEVNLILLGPVKLKWIALFFMLMDLVKLTDGNAGGHIAHFGGALYGFLYITYLRKGKDLSLGFMSMGSRIRNAFKPKPKMRVEYSSKQKQSSKRSKSDMQNQEVIDAILDKIARSGYDSLSKEEKEILFKASNN